MLRPSGIDRTLQQAAVQSDLAEKAALVDELDAILAQRGLYLAGEILDVDGRIGGFNFQWAWASGFSAGKSAAGVAVTSK